MMQLEERIALERVPRKVNINEETVPLLDFDENVDQLEARLHEQLEAGNTHLLFPIGQFYYDQVIIWKLRSSSHINELISFYK